jgi:hypothetical protein
MASFYENAISIYTKELSNLLQLIDKGGVWAKKNKMSEQKLLDQRLRPDMYNFCQQVQYSYFMALDASVGLTGKVAPKLAYDETSLKELKISVKKTITFLKSIKPKDLKQAARRQIPLFYDQKKKFSASKYLELVGIPNFFFHYTTAYDILRHIGVPIGKDDYLGL